MRDLGVLHDYGTYLRKIHRARICVLLAEYGIEVYDHQALEITGYAYEAIDLCRAINQEERPSKDGNLSLILKHLIRTADLVLQQIEAREEARRSNLVQTSELRCAEIWDEEALLFEEKSDDGHNTGDSDGESILADCEENLSDLATEYSSSSDDGEELVNGTHGKPTLESRVTRLEDAPNSDDHREGDLDGYFEEECVLYIEPKHKLQFELLQRVFEKHPNLEFDFTDYLNADEESPRGFGRKGSPDSDEWSHNCDIDGNGSETGAASVGPGAEPDFESDNEEHEFEGQTPTTIVLAFRKHPRENAQDPDGTSKEMGGDAKRVKI